MKYRKWINATALLVILLGATSVVGAQQATPYLRADCTSGDGAASCSCSGACWADGSKCGCR